MNALMELWLPILLSTVFIFIASSLIHMVFKWHAPDYHGLSNEDAVRAAIRAGNPSPGLYVLPYCKDMKEMASEAIVAKYKEGPVAFLTVKANGMPNMGASLTQWFLFSLLVVLVAAFLAAQAFGFDADHHHFAVHHIAVISFVGFGFGSICEGIWKGETWGSVAKYLLDALIYAAVTAATFYWLWPTATAA